MDYKEFLNLYKNKYQFFMWFLGAGVSVSAGIPSASNLIMQFKINIFCKNTGANPKLFHDLSNSTTRQILEDYFVSNNILPIEVSNDYAYYFEKAYPTEELRRQVIENAVKGRQPSFGQRVIASLMKLNACRIIWTTNFDKLIENAAYKLYNSNDELVVSTLDSNDLARDAVNNEKWPLLIKLHGDFQSNKIKNTDSELEKQDIKYRKLLIEQSQKYGMIVSGYSGRDDSIMETFNDAIDNNDAFPHGLFWLLRIGEKPCKKLSDLINKAKSKNINAHIIEIQNFDETMADIINQFDNIPDKIKEYLNEKMPKATFPPLPTKGKGFPIIRLNALPILDYPINCKLIDCEIGGYKEIQQAIQAANTNIVAIRKKIGVLAFGQLGEINKTFNSYNIKSIKDYEINNEKLQEGQQELNLLYQLLVKCFENSLPVKSKYKCHNYYLVIDKRKIKPQIFSQWKMGQYEFKEYYYGNIPKLNVPWAQAIKLKLEYRYNTLWLIIEPKIWIEDETFDSNTLNAIKVFVNSKLSNRFNIPSNQILDSWIDLLIGKNQNKHLCLFSGSKSEIIPSFTVSGITAYSGRNA
ncbi:TPA: hypothetical protein CPT88_00800 [Candidatus Gastranaerophilales bacterium HUM_8]|jgi:hypothetical protein|nr:MAG TPA: hypothetical protein CPT88_00800 [Candidatus Gastranaerophilales bacterium HUM_8]